MENLKEKVKGIFSHDKKTSAEDVADQGLPTPTDQDTIPTDTPADDSTSIPAYDDSSAYDSAPKAAPDNYNESDTAVPDSAAPDVYDSQPTDGGQLASAPPTDDSQQQATDSIPPTDDYSAPPADDYSAPPADDYSAPPADDYSAPPADEYGSSDPQSQTYDEAAQGPTTDLSSAPAAVTGDDYDSAAPGDDYSTNPPANVPSSTGTDGYEGPQDSSY